MDKNLKAPFPYFGGKRAIAEKVWSALGNVKHYLEPFFGSGAVLLLRPDYDSSSHLETVNDKDGYICNVWRSIKYDPEQTTEYCDWPVNHADLIARRKILLKNEGRLLGNLTNDDIWHDCKLAGYWIWAASCWIGRGLTRPNAKPHLGNSGTGVHKLSLSQRPHVAGQGMGIHKLSLSQIPHLSDSGCGVHKLSIADNKRKNILDWLNDLSDRLRNVRVVCGDWTRICNGNWQNKEGFTGVFFDPPYGITDRDTRLYHHDSVNIAHAVREWCIERGKKETYRIVLAGYEEHKELLNYGWTMVNWKAHGGYSNQGGSKNRGREVLYFSPHCLNQYSEQFEQLSLF